MSLTEWPFTCRLAMGVKNQFNQISVYFEVNISMPTFTNNQAYFSWILTVYITCTVQAPVFGTLNSAISNFQTWFVRTVMEVLKYCWMKETSNMQCNYNSFIKIINLHGLFRNALRCRKTGACPYGMCTPANCSEHLFFLILRIMCLVQNW